MLIIATMMLLTIEFASAEYGHSTSEVYPGTFQSGLYTFPSGISVQKVAQGYDSSKNAAIVGETTGSNAVGIIARTAGAETWLAYGSMGIDVSANPSYGRVMNGAGYDGLALQASHNGISISGSKYNTSDDVDDAISIKESLRGITITDAEEYALSASSTSGSKGTILASTKGDNSDKEQYGIKSEMSVSNTGSGTNRGTKICAFKGSFNGANPAYLGCNGYAAILEGNVKVTGDSVFLGDQYGNNKIIMGKDVILGGLALYSDYLSLNDAITIDYADGNRDEPVQIWRDTEIVGGDLYVSGTCSGSNSQSTCNDDVAESFKQTEKLEAGDVVMIDPKGEYKSLTKTTKAYDAHVIGVISTDPTLIMGKVVDGVPLALAGVVPTKVTNENGAIEVGDLLTTSSTPGYAMKCTDYVKCGVALVGHALEPMDAKNGVINVVVK